MVDPALESLINDAPVTSTGFAELKSVINVPFVSNKRLNVIFEPGDIERGKVIEAVAWIAGSARVEREEAERALFAAYLEAIEDGSCDFESAQAQLDWEAESTGAFQAPIAASRSSDIWSLVRLHTLHIRYGHSGQLFIDIEGDAAWDGEHGVALRSKNYGPLAIAKGH